MGEEKTFSFGGCDFTRTSPPEEKLTSNTKILNISIPFEDALKLNLALDECIRKLNKYKRNVKAGKTAAVNIAIHFPSRRITINEGKI